MTVLGVDVGGTFTDIVWWDGERPRIGKVATTRDQSAGVVSGAIDVTAGAPVSRFLHGTTVATNAILERKGSTVALVATEGYGDIVEIARQDRPSLYDSFVDRPIPLVSEALRFAALQRTGPVGAGLMRLSDLDALVARIVESAPEAVAIALLHSYADGSDEALIAEAIEAALPGIPVSRSSVVAPEFREFERTSTTVLNAYLAPVTGRYLARLGRAAEDAGLPGRIGVMRSSGGLLAASVAESLPASILLSGPAGGVVATAELGKAMGFDRLISFDMGGTSTDVCRIDDGRPEVAYERAIEGYPCRMPATAIHTVGAGGGSIGWIDAGGSLRVGPQSAGAEPGPAAYGKGGTRPTVTDANIVLGRIGDKAGLAGTLRVDIERARIAIESLAGPMGLTAEHAALGVVRVVEAHMARAVRKVSVEEGADPRRAMLVAFGGAGGLHATALARDLDMDGVLIPPYAGVFSALGLLLAPPRSDAARTVLVDHGGRARLAPLMVAIGEQAAAQLRIVANGDPLIRHRTDMRYLGQSHETSVDVTPGMTWTEMTERFHVAHFDRNGFSRPGDPVEVVTIRAEATLPPALTWDGLPSMVATGDPARGTRAVLTTEGTVQAGVWWRPALAPGTEIVGPAVIEEPESTAYLRPGDRAFVHESGVMEVRW